MKPISKKMQRQRKFLVVLPLLVLPFLSMAFWALGGGKDTEDKNTGALAPGLNTELPGASLKEDKGIGKLGYYEQAAADSLRLLEQMKRDPYFKKESSVADSILESLQTGNITGTGLSYTGTTGYTDPNEAKVYEKLGQLHQVIQAASTKTNRGRTYNIHPGNPVPDASFEKTGEMMAGTGVVPGSPTTDPEMNQLNGMLEKILDIQHPDRFKKPAGKDSASTLLVSIETPAAGFSAFGGDTLNGDTGFLGIPGNQPGTAANAVEAVVHASQVLVTGAVVKMRLLADISLQGHRIPKDQFVYGIASLNQERLEISVTSIRDGVSVYPVRMEVFDMDGLPGIYIPGAIGRDAVKQSGDNALQSLTPASLDPSIGAQAATAGIETAKTLLSRKVKLTRVMVKAGYKILLKNKTN